MENHTDNPADSINRETPELDSGAREEEGELETAENKPGFTDEDWKIFDRMLEKKFGILPAAILRKIQVFLLRIVRTMTAI